VSVPTSLEQIVDELARAMPRDQARAAVRAQARRLGIRARGLGTEEVLEVLDALAAGDGLAAVCARFAKARVLLAAGQDERAKAPPRR
jgi:hypothetical protein